MAENPNEQVVLRVNTVAEIFNAPDADPFASGEGTILGEAALDRLVLRQQVHPLHELASLPLVVALPVDQITPELEPQLAAGIKRYCAARIEDNKLEIRHSRLQHGVGMVVTLFVVLVVMAVGYLLLMTVLAGVSEVVQGLIVGAVCVFTWVILWDPLEALLFDWVAPARENRVLAQIMQMRVTVKTQG